MHCGERYNHFIRGQITDILESDDIVLVIDFRVGFSSKLPSTHRTIQLRFVNNTFFGDMFFE
jgi:formylmethanofuran dehydrogenase subunit B